MISVIFLMIRRPPKSTRTYTLFPYTTLFRSSSRKRCPSITEFRQIVPVHMLKPAAQNHGSLNQITTIGEQRIGRSALLRCHHVKKTVNEGAVTHVCDASFYPVRDAQSPPQPSRSEARRVGKECVSQCRSRWSP